ncbi:carbohydrate ABC transporter permease [Paenibacillus sp. HWE-109]|uniref:carbohydrate ABC transporter permease n=1 Tax=Paenibacillus sp. HWE-109 TaxID=1306526 RepID=UPI001EE0E180|nr:carbohydrate ABC transporter permease [Paenibacillus sp. HWE-109]UKS29441.1 carbohydrate ABC transporter permease [Paenibacillus sp. HWE-109]
MKIVKEISVWLLTLVILIPLFLVVINSVKTSAEADSMNLSFPKHIQFNNYATVIKEGKMIRAFKNSMIITVGSVLLTNIASAMGAFVLSRRRTKLNKMLYYYFIVGLIAPVNMIPTIKIMQSLHIMNTFQGIILLYSALMMPFTVFLYYGFIHSVPREMDESAVIDGSNAWQLFFRIQYPLLMPVTITSLLINFMNAWNDFILPLYVFNKSTNNPMTLAVYNFYGTYISSWNLVCAAIVLTTLPIVIVYLFGQRYIVSGMLSGAVKG